MVKISLVPTPEFDLVKRAGVDAPLRVQLIADMCRLNTINAVKLAGSGHLGSSFSAMEIVAWLYHVELNVAKLGVDHPDRDIYFSSKGHDVPGHYAVLHSVGILPAQKLQLLRRHGGVDGHPDVGVVGIEANSGSLGMGISKARGMAWAKRKAGRGGHVYVLIGDGELQEGQNYEALQGAVQHKIANLTVIVDHNKVQTDKPVDDIVGLGNLEEKFRAFGWHVARCDGHDLDALARTFAQLQKIVDKPKILIADTIKGRGVSFMEHPTALKREGVYRWHAGAPDDDSFERAHNEIRDRIDAARESIGLPPVTLEVVHSLKPSAPVVREYVADAYGRALLELAGSDERVVVLDGDLATDCRVREFEQRYPDRFIENGIAEQDMVSVAGGLARMGYLPVVNSFASFLAARANEQIYNNSTERTRVIYACHYAGLIPAGPGKSHQSIRDIALFGALANCTIIQPCNSTETHAALQHLLHDATGVGVLRLAIGPSPRPIELPPDYTFQEGRGAGLTDGDDCALFAYGPVMLHEALVAAEELERRGVGLRVINMPWLNRVDAEWLAAAAQVKGPVFVLEDHSPTGGLADRLAVTLASNGSLGGRHLHVFGVEGYPACGTPSEALRAHELDGASLANRILGKLELEATVAHVDRPSFYSVEAPQ